jgi:hypothetical protein
MSAPVCQAGMDDDGTRPKKPGQGGPVPCNGTNQLVQAPITGRTGALCYAESADGVNWEKPGLGLVGFKDNAGKEYPAAQTNIVLGTGLGYPGATPGKDGGTYPTGSGVTLDEREGEARFKMLGTQVRNPDTQSLRFILMDSKRNHPGTTAGEVTEMIRLMCVPLSPIFVHTGVGPGLHRHLRRWLKLGQQNAHACRALGLAPQRPAGLRIREVGGLRTGHTDDQIRWLRWPSAGKKTVFLSHLYTKMIFLPRQARDKHRENSKKRPFSCRSCAFKLSVSR